MLEEMKNAMKKLEKAERVIEEVENEYKRLMAKDLQEGLTDKEQAQFELLQHLDSIFYRCR